ncbi:Imidazole glycerol phosphate synthase subunit HisH 1 [Anaerohalosphaera lusitana]|uniref:Imidazole glycerol phosphate synthase subunit HisH n=1 Tax=Anaerohalosphaera lusitana TaxID=1936003 RepID=A0A1U9NJ26_9BACT|nr:imidazole glycerol phosphate synthase subunit HisH [Anaerohalosphaera lusitana]AQT67825.1 Imidazole glycerol phosphate synthase subunit HisH 1 [Anaerohalosphaera lusitana]
MIVVIDYSVGNVRSVCKALNHIGCETKLSRKREDIESADGIILPGVAAYGFAVKELSDTADIIKDVAKQGKPLLGICVGYQLLFDKSYEKGEHAGLGLISGEVVPLPPGLTVPHMGWNSVKSSKDMDLFKYMRDEEHFYFAHSYHAKVTDPEAKIANTDYGSDIVASVQKQSIYGVQFHPEKSGPVGLKFLETFNEICLAKKNNS